MQIVIDADKCIASGGCVLACPEVFSQDDDGIVVVLDLHPPDGLADKVTDAINSCPAGVIDVQ